MSEWKILLTPEFKQELKDIYRYIANVLLSVDSAKRQTLKIIERIENLNEMPAKFSLVEKEPWRSRGLRKMVVDNYIVFYLVNESKKRSNYISCFLWRSEY